MSDDAVELTVELSSAAAMVAEPIDLRIQVDAPTTTRITMPAVGESIGDFAVIQSRSVSELPVEGKAGRRRWVTSVRMEAIETGDRRIPAFEILFQLPASPKRDVTLRQGSIRSEPMSVQIVSILEPEEEPTQFRDIKAPADATTARAHRSSLPWVLAGAALGVAAAIAMLTWARQTRRQDPKQWALEAVNRIESEYRAESVSIEQVHRKLSSVIRGYLENSLAIPATLLSSEELVIELENVSIPDPAKQRLIRFLSRADELKFSAGRQWNGQNDEMSFESCRTIIQECQHSIA
jgi:hypothetical protein